MAFGEVTLFTYCVSPIHATKVLDVVVFAEIATCAPALYDPLPLPPVIFSVETEVATVNSRNRT